MAKPNPEGYLWLILAASASVGFATTNALKTELVHNLGYKSVLYNSTGSVLSCSGYTLYQCFQNYRKTGVFWNPANIIKDGKV